MSQTSLVQPRLRSCSWGLTFGHRRSRLSSHAPPKFIHRCPMGQSQSATRSESRTVEAVSPGFDIQKKLVFLKEDLTHLFDDQGIDSAQYDKKVDFLDPITRYDSLQGYLYNIAMLKRVFNPAFQLHDLRETGLYELTSRWTMTMEFSPTRGTPVEKFWKPTLIFTGTSIYGFNPANGKINRHIDTWDSIDNQNFFSIEGFADFWRQFLATYRTPQLETPEFVILKRKKAATGLIYEVRQYKPFLVAQTAMDDVDGQPQGTEVSPAGQGINAFNALARYIFGGNERGEKMAMTTPVFTSSTGTMQFVIGPSAHQSLSTVPAPLSSTVRPVQVPEGLFGSIGFPGVATPRLAAEKAAQLRSALERDGLQPSQEWLLARYNDPSTPPPFRKNEVLIPISQFSLWH